MKVGRVYSLERDREVLGILTVAGGEMFGIHGDFRPSPAFETYRSLFDEADGLTSLVDDDDSVELIESVELVLDHILALQLVLGCEGDVGFRDVLLGILGSHFHFRPLTPEEEPL